MLFQVFRFLIINFVCKKAVNFFQVSTTTTMIKAFGVDFFCGSILKFMNDLLTFVSPMLLKLIIQFATSSDYLWKGIAYSLILLLSTTIQTISLGQYFYSMFSVGICIKSALTSAIYRKSLRVSGAGKMEATTGEVVNLMSVDIQRVVDL